MSDPYVYPGTVVLKNKFDIHDIELLKKTETTYVIINASNYPKLLKIAEKCSLKNMLEYHKFLFNDIYEWAGSLRTINMEKAERALGGWSIEYGEVSTLKQSCSHSLLQISKIHWQKMDLAEQTQRFCDSLAEVWKLHPFREGNTRSTSGYLSNYVSLKGVLVAQQIFSDNSKYFRDALVAYNAFYQDGDFSQKGYLKTIVEDALQTGAETRKEINRAFAKSGCTPNSKMICEMVALQNSVDAKLTISDVYQISKMENQNSKLAKEIIREVNLSKGMIQIK